MYVRGSKLWSPLARKGLLEMSEEKPATSARRPALCSEITSCSAGHPIGTRRKTRTRSRDRSAANALPSLGFAGTHFPRAEVFAKLPSTRALRTQRAGGLLGRRIRFARRPKLSYLPTMLRHCYDVGRVFDRSVEGHAAAIGKHSSPDLWAGPCRSRARVSGSCPFDPKLGSPQRQGLCPASGTSPRIEKGLLQVFAPSERFDWTEHADFARFRIFFVLARKTLGETTPSREQSSVINAKKHGASWKGERHVCRLPQVRLATPARVPA